MSQPAQEESRSWSRVLSQRIRWPALVLVAAALACGPEGFGEDPLSTDAEALTIGTIKVGAGSYYVSGINLPRGTDQLIIYTPAHGATTRTNGWGAEAAVVNGKVTSLVDRQSTGAPALSIPTGGVVLSGHGAARQFLLTRAKVGTSVQLPGEPPATTNGTVKVGSNSYALAGTNITRGVDQLILYSPAHGSTTGTNQWGAEAAVVNGRVTTLLDRQASGAPALAIPAGGVILSGHGAARLFLLSNAKIGAMVTLPGQAAAPPPPPSSDVKAVTLGNKSFNLSGTNIGRGAGQLILYTPAHGTTTGTNQWGVEVAVVNGKVSQIRAWQPGMAIPADGYVLSGHEAAADFLLGNAVIGGSVVTSTSQVSGTAIPAVPALSAIPMPFFGGYLAWWRNLLPDSLPSQYNFLLYAFAEIDSAGNPRFPYPVPSALGTQNAARRSLNPPKYMVLSLGGANGVAQTPTTLTHENNMVNGLIKLCDTYGFAGIDWDIESGAPDLTNPAATPRIVNISRRLRDHYAAQGKPFFITIAPYGSVEGTYRNWGAALWRENLLTAVNYQFYNGGSPPTAAQVRTKLNEWKALLPGFANKNFSIGHVHKHVWPGTLGSTTTPYTAMRDIWTAVKDTHPGVAGTWAWDVGNNSDTDMYQFANVVYPAVGAP